MNQADVLDIVYKNLDDDQIDWLLDALHQDVGRELDVSFQIGRNVGDKSEKIYSSHYLSKCINEWDNKGYEESDGDGYFIDIWEGDEPISYLPR